MNISQYLHESSRTAPKKKHGVTDLEFNKENLVHAALGLATEVLELRVAFDNEPTEGVPKDNAIEEIGDILWYCALALRSIQSGLADGELEGRDWPTASPHTSDFLEDNLSHVTSCAESAIDTIKRHRFYGVGWEATCVRLCTYIGGLLVALAGLMSLMDDREEAEEPTPVNLCTAATKNIAKLRVRFPGKFQEHRAIDRDVEAEMKAMKAVRGEE